MLTSIPSPPQSVWMLGPIPIRAYALFILAGILIAWYMGDKRYQRRGGPENVSEDIGIWMVLAGIVGARIYHVITSPTAYFGDHGDWTKIFRIWEGGLGIWGAVLFGALAAWLMLRRYNLRFGAFADAFIPGVMLAQAIGRMGNYFNQELFGAPTDVPWALEIDDAHLPAGFPSGTTFHPTFLYEMLWCIAGFMFLLWAERKFSLHGGQVLALYIIVYTLGRVWIEYLRIDDATMIMGLRLNVWTSLIVCVGGILAFFWLRDRLKTHPEMADIYRVQPEVTDEQKVIG
ncbi:prolipoprotein diacylglyceryl transferase [Arcanobacterium haemolyticum]|uniref:Phosphatidylglycerol--prolipoprotein diacylglyceryl transferase n=1 Tax=Arcanobacterium haemolyticum (strain ATCC 9345 / DSM 20595 / CCM 5947 / CCUG 17215 / LMG 16163 / NBRC 15585 / NCTC 8452 / 11018) TaxID=644284 RepID=D7BNX6_ARCHD|nr:prolipoprotein diacylglyceryl transferase [Arcanobacterium haemolyticum]ADH92625.1 prolipoprotein diacylglyceryl transferase [Arcanobacterium haemolyticum DSM 20595]QCX46737.1 prolipoprotein diacylglyceryl transferase [Arcanobacterium haemolyticum]SQH28640.1 Prolipoprotein diacylglyceryl transferase [Arcanobacterium haemolyticum]